MSVKRDRILIEKANIPYRFSIALPRTQYELEIRYNETADLFTIGLYKSGDLICIEPIVYGTRLFGQLYQPGIYPALSVTPVDDSNNENRVTWDNFNTTVFLEIDNAGD
jgi:hypothetical protein